MSGTGLALFNTAMPTVPAEVNKFFDENTNMVSRQAVPTLGYGGKQWSIALNGDTTLLTKVDADGERQPVQVMKVVVLDYAKRRGRAYYEGAYDPNKVSMPKCWSDDGFVPNADVKEKQNDKCETCPMAAKGSKVTEQNKAVTACAQHRMIAVVPAHDLSFQPLRLKIAITSDYDGQSPDNDAAGWFGFSNYTDMLRAKQVPHTAKLVTKIKFDNTNYPKLIFSPDRWLTPDELVTIIPVVQSPETKALIDGSWTVNGADGQRTGPSPAADSPAPPAKDAKAAEPEKIAGPTAAEIEAKRVADEKAAKKAAKVEAARLAAEAAAAAAKAAEADDDDEQIVLPGVATGATTTAAPVVATKPPETAKPPGAKSTPAAPVVTTSAPGDVSDLLKDWGGAA